jgi:outer membrane receptor for ferrienterochelin and colicin
VLITGTTAGTITDNSGDYSISVPSEQAVLQFSYVGYLSQSIPVGNQRMINVSLEEELAVLDEIVVVGYSSKRQSELSSSVAVVSEQTLQTAPVSPSLDVMLQGRVPGLVISNTSGEPGSGADMLIRGPGSIGASTTPLIVVDGIIGGDYNPLDVKSITVLKDHGLPTG